MRPSEEAERDQLELALQQGRAFESAVLEMTEREADDGGQTRSGDYLIGYAVEEAEGMWQLRDGQLGWEEPDDANVHVEVVVRDAGDGRSLPGLTVRATLVDPQGNEVGTHVQPFLWHPWLFHYGRNWTVPGDGAYTLRIRVEAPDYGRHDHENGRRFAVAAEVEFSDVKIRTGRK
jgi:hypothetical protein